jgi:CcmD family protein
VSTGEKYLWAAYLVVFGAVLLYVVLISLKLGRLERELASLAESARDRETRGG